MKDPVANINDAENAFSKQAKVFDSEYSDDIIVNYKRGRVREHLEKYLKPNSTILELNSGTGEDAVYLAEKGHSVHCTDVSAEMLKQLKEKVTSKKLNHLITSEQCSFLKLSELKLEKKFDHIFSNFGGLNCTDQLDKVLHSLADLLNNEGKITLIIMPRFCLWENALALKGNFKTAFRRWKKNGASSHIEGVYFKCWYYHPKYIIDHLKKTFTLLQVEGLCTIVPPSYLKNFPNKRPRFFKWLVKTENRLSTSWPWKNCGDYFIISMKKISKK